MPENPYQSPSVESQLQTHARSLAAEMARREATRGMIVQKLRKENLDEQTANDIADQALHAVALRERIVGVGVIVTGLALLAIAWYSTTLFRARTPIILAMFGVIVLGIGISKVAHRARLPLESPDSKSRIR